MRYSILILGTAFSLFSCKGELPEEQLPTEKNTAKPFVLDQLVGTWKSEEGKSFERWEKREDGTYSSDVYILRGKDTVFIENATVFEEGGKWIFKNKVHGQNDEKTVRFTSVISGEKTIQFSNPQHDFPHTINYTLSDAKTLNAFIVGKNEKGETDTIPFNYTRLK